MDTSPTNLFNFQEIVKIGCSEAVPMNFWGAWAQVVGMSFDESTQRWEYGVMIFDDNMMVWSLDEKVIIKSVTK